MNKHCFRVVFNKTLQRLVVVSELAKSEGKSTEKKNFSFPSITVRLKTLVFSLFCALGFISFSNLALADALIIRADKTAPKTQQPIILSTANGLPQVNIQTPNDKGLSHNKYSQFDVAEKGAILNNSRTNTSTQLAGNITANPYLARGEAKVILNEVNSSKPSVMKGYMEVAGKKAHVIIANPSGLHCDGCGVINADRATFTTGKPEINHGVVEKFQVEKGKVAIAGKGLDNSNVDYTEILARETQVNAGIWSKKEAKVITDKNTVKRSDSDNNLQIISTKQPLADESQPQFAIDVGKLGGMYSGKIYLVGTEKGVGVRNAGHIGASFDTLQIDSQGRIVNTGILNAEKAMNLTATQDIDNQGKIENKQGNIQLRSKAKIENRGSIVARGGNIDKKADSHIQQSGETLAKGNVSYTAPTIHATETSLIAAGVNVTDDAQGETRQLEKKSAKGKSIQLTSSRKTTAQGKNIASGGITISASEVNVSQSHTSAHGIEIKTTKDQIQANHATLIADKALSLTTPTTLDTQHSQLNAENLSLFSQKLINHSGEIQARSQLALTTHLLDNQAGYIRSQTGHIHANKIDNHAISETGSLIYGNLLSLQVDHLDNQGTKAKGNQPTQGIQGSDLTFEANTLNNQQGGIYSTEKVNISAAHLLSNQQGEIVALNKIQIKNPHDLMINNQKGVIQAHHAIDLQAKGLLSEGLIRTLGNLTLDLKDSLTLHQAFEVGNNLSLTTQGDFNNHAEQRVGNKMTILANHLVNNAHAELSANETTLSVKQLTNRGLIDGNETRITGTDITNIGTGRIYGNHLALKANKLENLAEKQKDETQSATIAARKRLDFGVSSLTNRDHSLILSLDKLFIGGALDSNYRAIGKATLVDNGSATIEALGDGGINTTRLKNHDLYIKTGIKTDKQYFKEYSPENSSDVYLGRDGVNAQGWLDWNNNNRHDRNAYFRFDNGTSVGSPTWFQKFYTRTTHTTTLVHQDPAKIAFGGNLSLAGEHLLNYASKLLIGEKLLLGDRVIEHNLNNSDLSSKGTHLENIDLIGEIHRLDEGETSTLVSKRKHKGTKKVWAHYTENINENFNRTLPVETFGFSLVLNQIGRPISSEAEIAKKADPKTIQVENLDLPHVNKSPIETVPLPQASLYKINPDAPHGYLVETDTRFTDPKQWLSSDYMFKQLRHNHENVHKRLGDGFYEQRLINEQIHQLTGRRYLEGYHDDLAQYQALMNSGVKYAKQFNLALGVGLTAKQMSELTTDMVWLVNKDVTLADGRHLTVLVPQVYLVARNSNISAQGAVISANKIIGAVDNLENSGVIAGRDLTLIHANQLKNQGMILGESVDLSAKQNLINLGGKIEAVKDLSLYAGKKLDIQSTLSSAENKAGNFARTVLDQKASVKVTGKNGHLNLHSDGNLTIKAADIESQGALTASAGNHLQITTLKLNNKEHNNTDSDNYYRLDQQYEVGSHLVGQDTVMLIGQNNTTLRQASVSSQTGKTMIGAKGDVRIESGTQSETLATHSKTSNHDMVSKSSEIRGHYHDNTEAVASEVDGKHVTLASEKGKVDINGSSVVADKQLSIAGKQGVNITAAQNSHYEENEHIESKSGLMGGGGIGFTVGSKKEQIEQDQMQQSAVASQVGSLSGNTDIHTAGEYRQTGSIVTSKNADINISAKSANISAVRSDYKSHYKYQMEQKGFSLALTGAVANAIQAVDSVTKSVKMVGESKNNRINAMAAANVGFEAMNAVDNLSNVADAVSKGSVTGGAVGVRLAYGQQKSVQTQHSEGNLAEKSQINAGGKVNIQTQGAGKDATLSITGSDVVGLGGTHLKADGNINIEAADENHLERSNNKSSGFNLGVAVQFGNHVLAGVTASGNVAKGYGNGESQAWVASQVGSQNSQTIIESTADTAIKGSQMKGNQISVSAENLSIKSLQDTAKYQGKQQNISGQATMGYGFSASGSYNKSKINSDYASVKTQAGILAGDGGYDVDIKDKVQLTGGAILSSAESDKNALSARTFSFTDIKNHANAEASSTGFDMGFSVGRDQTSKEDKEKNEIYRAERERNGETFEQTNPNQANRSPIQFGLGENDVHSADFYAISKIGAVNLLSNTKKSENASSTTSSVISNGRFTIQDSEGQENIKGITKSTTEQTHHLDKPDYQSLQKEAETDSAIKRQFFSNMAGLTDEAYRTMFIAEHRMMTAKIDEKGEPIKDKNLENQLNDEAKKVADEKLRKGEITQEVYEKEIDKYRASELGKGRNVYQLREVSDQERNHLQKVTYKDPLTGKSETRYVVAFNGIFNDENAAAKFAWQNYVAKESESGKINTRIHKDIYFVHHPEAKNKFSELLVAGYEKIFETSFGNLLGMDNSSLQAKQIMTKYGKDNLFIGSHSRGTLTVANAINSLNTQENREAKLLSGTKVKMVGPAANVTNTDNSLSQLQTGSLRNEANKEGAIRIENHQLDPVGSLPFLLGGNPSTMNDNYQNRGIIKRTIDMFGDDSSVHNCHGLGQKQCVTDGYRKDEKDLIMNKERTIYDLNRNSNHK